MDPHLILFDEPTAFLDPRNKRNFIHLLRSMVAARLIATHDLDLVRNSGFRSLELNKGALVYDSAEAPLPEREH